MFTGRLPPFSEFPLVAEPCCFPLSESWACQVSITETGSSEQSTRSHSGTASPA